MASNIQVLAVLYSEMDLLNKIENLKQQGYSEEDLHVMAEKDDHFEKTEQRTALKVEETSTFSEKFKGILGKGGINELDLSDEEKNRYKEDLSKGGVLVYIDKSRENISEVMQRTHLKDREGNPIDPEASDFVASVDNVFDEQEDRLVRGESFQNDPILMHDENHISFSTQKNPEVEKSKGAMTESEKHSISDRKYK